MKKKIKYYYNYNNGLVYRQNLDDSVDMMLSSGGDWTSSAEYESVNTDHMKPLSPITVRHFERSGGYTPHFRTAI